VQKQPQYSTTVLSSLVAARENEHWQEQRQELTPPFLPLTGLAPLFPKSVERAKFSVERLTQEAVKGDGVVDMNEFLMYEAFAQLMHALIGETDEFQHKHNKAVRDAWIWKRDPSFLKEYAFEFLPRVQEAASRPDCSPLAKVLGETSQDPITLIGNLMLFSVAGHDTTGHTMSFLVFELARHPEHQRKLQEEVDRVAAELGDRDLEFKDLKKFPFMTRCIMEALRMWPVVPQGTYKILERDDTCQGPGGKVVRLPKGTMVQICTWQLHRNPAVWGPDAHIFNPEREYLPHEIFGERVFASHNPSSHRFSPFQHPPRDCLGRNFSMMEQRAVMFHLLRRFSFELMDAYKNLDPKANIGLSYGTMGPRNLTASQMEQHWLGVDRWPHGLPLRVVPRSGHTA
jgi:cytochrome P450